MKLNKFHVAIAFLLLVAVLYLFGISIQVNVIKMIKDSTRSEAQSSPNASTCSFNVLLTQEELENTVKCTQNFATMRSNRGNVNGPAMEKERVDGHSYLNENSQVLEVGGYTGEDAAKLINKYNPYYTALEPIPRFQKVLEERYKDNPKFTLLKFGLGRKATTLTLNVNSDATSLFRGDTKKDNSKQEIAEIREITNFFKEIDVENKPIDLLTINCEGCEFELLELLISNHIVDHLKNIQFQFHIDLPGIANQECRYCQIMSLLARTHEPSFQYLYVWQSWKRRT